MGQISERLDLPQPEKSRILLEIVSDVEDMYELYRGQGMSGKELVRRAREKYAVSDEALAELVQIHESLFRKLLGRISEQVQTRWERVLITALGVFIAVFAGRELASTLSLQDSLNQSRGCVPCRRRWSIKPCRGRLVPRCLCIIFFPDGYRLICLVCVAERYIFRILIHILNLCSFYFV